MRNDKHTFNLPITILVAAVVACLFAFAVHRIEIDTDIIQSLPQNDTVISDARYVILNHPIQDQLVIDLSLQKDDPDALVAGADFIEKEMEKSGLFKEVGIKAAQDLFPELVSYIIDHLPVMFTQKDLDDRIRPILKPERVYQKLEEDLSLLLNIEGIGQADMISKDPFGLRNLVMVKLAGLAPSKDVRIFAGHLLSSDRRHLLITAKPECSGTDTTFSRKATELFNHLSRDLDEKYAPQGYNFTLTPVGAYRAALDNERLAKKDMQRAILFSTIGIALLLILAFPRPYLGLLSFLPAIAGTLVAFFVYSLMHHSISILTIGFGGAIISITVDHGIAYLLFLDRPYETSGKQAAREVRAVGLLATLTTVGAFSVLSISGFPILSEIGQFAALGITFSFLFVHTVFPSIFPAMPPAKRKKTILLQAIVNNTMSGAKYKAYAALVFAMIMLFFAKPEFHVDLRAMNTVTKETRAAEDRVATVWGNIFSKVFLLTQADSIENLQKTGDRLSWLIEQDLATGVLSSAFAPSMIFPGEERGRKNFAAWQTFWNTERLRSLKKTVKSASSDLGFAPNAFDPFYKTVCNFEYKGPYIPEKFLDFLSIFKGPDTSGWIQFLTLTPGDTYMAESFFSKYRSGESVRVFDPRFFSKRLGEHLSSTFLKMVIIIGSSAVLLLFLFFFDLKLTLISLLPVCFAFICTLGTLKLIGHPLDIPGLMLSIVVIGMGIDYSIYFVRSYQRYGDDTDPSLGLIRMAVFLASASTIIGFGVLNFADHSMLKSAGLTSLLGIFYSLTGAFFILPPILKPLFAQARFQEEAPWTGTDRPPSCVIRRYRHMEAFPRLLARFKTTFDPLFSELPCFLNAPKTIMDIGSGYGVNAVWLLELFPEARVYGIEPDYDKVRISSRVIGKRGSIKQGSPPDLPIVPNPPDTAIMIDLMHYLKDDDLRLTLKRVHDQLQDNGSVLIRTSIPYKDRVPRAYRIQDVQRKIQGKSCYYRSADQIKSMIRQAGFQEVMVKPSGTGNQKTWFLAKT